MLVSSRTPTPLRAAALTAGAQIGFFAASSPFNEEKFAKGIELFEARGFSCRVLTGAHERQAYLAGSDTRRLEELHALWRDPEIPALWAIRGGYGAMRLLDALDYASLARNPKIFVGFSDVTALLWGLHARTGLVGFHAPQLCSLPSAGAELQADLFRLLMRPEPFGPLFCGRGYGHAAAGRLMPGNLTLVASLLGTSYLPDLTGAILAIEDVNEEPYRVDRLLTHLELAGLFDVLAGLVTGHFTQPDGDAAKADLIRSRIVELAEKHHLPLITDAPFGHVHENHAMPLGVRAELHPDGSLTLVEAAVV